MKLTVKLTLTIILSLVMLISMVGCNNSPHDGNINGEPEITVVYLSTEYADQLTRDGAIHIFGTIEIDADENGNPFVKITEKELVIDSTLDKGYYIADKNLQSTFLMSNEARTTHLAGDTSIANIMTTENFVKAVSSDKKLSTQKASGYDNEKFYDIYVIDDQIELILAHYLN
jgi:uncharacterized lipoprotein YehR (DUF1307 family)